MTQASLDAIEGGLRTMYRDRAVTRPFYMAAGLAAVVVLGLVVLGAWLPAAAGIAVAGVLAVYPSWRARWYEHGFQTGWMLAGTLPGRGSR